MPEIRFPASTAPSRNATENGGRLINAYAEKAPEGSRSQFIWRRAPGLIELFMAGSADYRGSIEVNGVLYLVNGTSAHTITESGGVYTVTALTGTVPGEGPVMMARNMKSPTPDILGVHSAGMSSFDGAAVSDFSDADLPSANSITYKDGFFVVTSADGRAFASGLNDTTFSELDYTTAEAATDGLKRAVSFSRDLLLMGDATIEFYNNTGNATGFPFTRGYALPLGLLSTYAIAGMEEGFTAPVIFVGNDRKVYQLNGYTPKAISTSHIERLIEAVADVTTLQASVYVAGGHLCWVLSCDDWTWVYDVTTGFWHERASYQQGNWRAHFGIKAFGKWLTFERGGSTVYQVSDTAKREGSAPLIFEVRSSQFHGFPDRAVIPEAQFDFVTGVGIDRGVTGIETDPQVSISWSDDGGRTFSNARLRALGTQGETRRIAVRRTGMTGRVGRQWRLTVSDPVEVSLLGGAFEFEARK